MMTEQLAGQVGPSGIDIAYERFGDPGDPAVVLIMGAGAQLINWPEEFCTELAARGLQVIRFDNRDVGRSTHLSEAPAPDVMAALGGDLSQATYNLSDLAADTIGLLDALGIGAAHLVGMSMGGMIAQTIAIEYPERVLWLTSISSTTGDPAVGRPAPGSFGGGGTVPDDRDGYIAWQVQNSCRLRSPGYEFDEAAVTARAALAYDRGYDPDGMMRQFVAVIASNPADRTQLLRKLDVPALVIHGADDLMIDVSGGRATAEAIPESKLLIVDGMGHHLPRELYAAFADEIAALVERGATAGR